MEWVTEARLHGWSILWSALDASLKVLLLALGAWLLCRLRALRHASSQHAVWATVLFGLWVLPWLPMLVPPLARARIPIAMNGSGAAPGGGFLESHLWSAWPALLLVPYVAVAAFMLSRLGLGVFYSRHIVRASRPIDDDLGFSVPRLRGRAVAIRASSAVVVPVTVGLFRPAILLPDAWVGWSATKIAAAVEHELAHIHRFDYGVNLLARAGQCVFWFHPIAWLLPRRLSILAERSCDALVVERTGDADRYARDLLELASELEGVTSRLSVDALAAFEPSSFDGRIDAILSSSSESRGRLASGAARMSLVLCGVLLMWPVSSAKLQGRAVWATGDEVRAGACRSDAEPHARRATTKVSRSHGRTGSRCERKHADRRVRRRTQ